MDILAISIMHHFGIVLFLLGTLSFFNQSHPILYFVSLIYLYLVHERYVMKLRKKVQFEERKQANQNRVLTDSETVRWLNHAVEKIWPICMEQIVSQKILLPIVPWFLEKYKPWTAKKAVVQSMYLGRNPPMFTEMRVLHQSPGDDHLVLELGMNFCTADDMDTIIEVKLRKRLGFGLWTKLHVTGMHIEGKVLIGVKFLHRWPFLDRLRVCFAEPPYFQMTAKPIFSRGLDVTELPGIAGWLDKLLSIAFEQSLVQPNMLVVDVGKFVQPEVENWFYVDEKEPIAFAKVEVVEASDLKPSDLNGLADPYVKGKLGSYRFRTKIKRKTLTPKWHEEFKMPICTWEGPNVLAIEVRDKDQFVDDVLGDCTVNMADLRDGSRHEMWLPLLNMKTGRICLAITVEANVKAGHHCFEKEEEEEEEDDDDDDVMRDNEAKQDSCASHTGKVDLFVSSSLEKSSRVADNFEAVTIEGQDSDKVWVFHPGTEASHIWEPRKGKERSLENQANKLHDISLSSINKREDAYSEDANKDEEEKDDDDDDDNDKNLKPKLRHGLNVLGSVFHRNLHKAHDVGPHDGLEEHNRSVDEGRVGESLGKTNMKDVPNQILRCSEKFASTLKHRLSRKGSSKARVDSPRGGSTEPLQPSEEAKQ